MGFLDRLSSTKRPQLGTTVLPASQVRAALLSLNRVSSPYRIVDGTSEGVDLIAEWKIVDTQWYEIFAKAGLSKVFRIYMKLDEMNHSVRTSDREYLSHGLQVCQAFRCLRLLSKVRCNRLSSARHMPLRKN